MHTMTRLRLAASLCIATVTSLASADLSPDELRTLCLELGVTPATMTAMGLNLTQSSEAMGRLEEQDAVFASLRSAQSQLGNLALQLKTKRREARTAETVAEAQAAENEVQSLETQIATASVSIETHRNQLCAAFMPAGTDLSFVQQMCTPPAGAEDLPAEYRVLVLDEDDASALAAALAAERRANARSEPVDPDVSQLINQYRNLPAVVAARNHMTAWMPQVEQLFFLWQ